MPTVVNNITLFKNYLTTLMDQAYVLQSLTSNLDGNPDLARAGANADELIIPVMNMQGLGDYSRTNGYADGAITITNETIKCNFDRSRMFNIDAMDNLETAGVAFGQAASLFLRERVVPELDAFRFACYAKKAKNIKQENLADGIAIIQALRAATTLMDEDSVTVENRMLFITPTLEGVLHDLDTIKSREVLNRFASVKIVPQTRFYTAIDQQRGRIVTVGSGASATTIDETDGGYKKAADAKGINFMIVQKDALIQFSKHVAPKIITPDQNQSADGYKFGYRHVAIADVYANKRNGIYLSHAAA